MKFEVFKSVWTLPLVVALAACGGGGSDEPAANSSQNTNQGGNGATTSTTPPAAFVKGARPRASVLAAGLQFNGVLDAVSQQTTGGMVTIGSYAMTGSNPVDVAGDASFAMGRWLRGTVTTPSRSDTLSDSNAYHYVVYNQLTSFGANATYTCEPGVFTTPTKVSGTSVIAFGRTIGTATLSISNVGASVTAELQTDAGVEAVKQSLNGLVTTPGAIIITSRYLNNETGAQITVAEGGAANKLRVVLGYQTKVNGSDYRGVGSFLCTMQ